MNEGFIANIATIFGARIVFNFDNFGRGLTEKIVLSYSWFDGVQVPFLRLSGNGPPKALRKFEGEIDWMLIFGLKKRLAS